MLNTETSLTETSSCLHDSTVPSSTAETTLEELQAKSFFRRPCVAQQSSGL